MVLVLVLSVAVAAVIVWSRLVVGSASRDRARQRSERRGERGVPRTGEAQPLAVEPRLAQAAVRAVADVEPDQLIAAAARAQVLGKRSSAESEGASGSVARHRLHLLAGLAIDIDPVGDRGRERLATGGARAQAVDLASVLHGRETISA